MQSKRDNALTSRGLQDTALRYFLAVVRSGSLSEAAQHLNVTPSAVSRQVATLEGLLDVPLFERRPRGMVPSAAGELLAAHVRRAELEADRVVSDIQGLRGLRRGRVRIGSSAGFALEFLPRVIAEFHALYPGLQFHLQTASPAAVSTLVLHGDVDLGLTYSRSAEQGLQVVHRQPAPVLAIMRPDHPLARHASVTLAQMHGYPIALPEPDNTVRQLFDIGCSERRLAFQPVLTSNQFETLTSFVLHGGGLSISGELTVRGRVERGELHAAQIRESGMRNRSIELQTLAGRTLPEGAATFLEFLRERLMPRTATSRPARGA